MDGSGTAKERKQIEEGGEPATSSSSCAAQRTPAIFLVSGAKSESVTSSGPARESDAAFSFHRAANPRIHLNLFLDNASKIYL
ncbi:MAG: hypothetical protein GY820_28780 [Gammaproteobacteria bacterium]|nr:hypothetical protein [Gammaproteobacteria bacterium]